MKKILILGAGKSSWYLINYLYRKVCNKGDCELFVADIDKNNIENILKEYPHINNKAFDIFQNNKERKQLIRQNDITVSLLPAFGHEVIAKDCLQFGKHLITPSYISDGLMAFHKRAKESGLIFLNEIGLDPGIDHISAMNIIDKIKKNNGKLYSFESYTGGLVADGSDNNPWNYKLSWSTIGVITAGQGVAQYYENSKLKLLPYNRLFKNIKEFNIPGHPDFEAYFNRDSVKYKDIYKLNEVECIIRGTLRKKGFCKSWGMLVDLGITDNSYILSDLINKSYKEFTEMFLPEGKGTIKERLAKFLNIPDNSTEMSKIEWLGLLSEHNIKINKLTPAQVLETLLSEKWKMQAKDKDLIVMLHIFKYSKNKKHYLLKSYLSLEGDDSQKTAMAKTVGLPMAIAVKLIIENKISGRGVIRPVTQDIYEPVMKELEDLGIRFKEEVIG